MSKQEEGARRRYALRRRRQPGYPPPPTIAPDGRDALRRHAAVAEAQEREQKARRAV